MKERPILFSGAMVRAILDGHKTMTRRALKKQPPFLARVRHSWFDAPIYGFTDEDVPAANWWKIRCPYGQPGDRLWVRERHCFLDVTKSALSQFPLGPENNNEVGPDVWNLEVEYSDGTQHDKTVEGDKPKQTRARGETGWRPSIHMPRWASRITLEITAVRVERLQDIGYSDILSEGIQIGAVDVVAANAMPESEKHSLARDAFFGLWESINGPCSWALNPWVWVVEFKRA